MCLVVHFVFIASILVSVCSLSGAQEWSYSSPIGPANWSSISPRYSECGNGMSQSPININTGNTVLNEGSGLLFFHNDEIRTGTLLNDGHIVEFQIDDLSIVSSPPLIVLVHDMNDPFFAGRAQGEQYILSQIQFHWGANGSQLGAEHYIDSVGGPGEVHFIYINGKYGNFNNAANQSDGLATLAFRLGICPNSAFSELFGSSNQNLGMLSENGSRVSGISWRFGTIYSCSRSVSITCTERFYVYYGSLTSPPCYQSVIWWLSDQFLCITAEQLQMLRTQRVSANGPFLSDNYRPEQALNGRTVIRVGNTPNSTPSIDHVVMIYLVSLLVLLQFVFQ